MMNGEAEPVGAAGQGNVGAIFAAENTLLQPSLSHSYYLGGIEEK